MQNETLELIKEKSKVASDEMRKIVSALLITVFGLAYQETSFKFKSTLLILALLSLIIYLFLDIFQYISTVICIHVQKFHKIRTKIEFALFYSKFIFSFLGLLLIIAELLCRYSK